MQTIVVPSGEFQLREYEPSDESNVLELWKFAFGKDLALSMWRWKYVDNPFGARILMCLDENGQKPIVVYGGIPYRTNWNGRVVEAVQLMDIMSHPDYRKTGLFVKTGVAFCDQFSQGENAALVYGFPGEYHFLIGKKYLAYAEMESGVGYFSGDIPSVAGAKRFLGGRVEEVPRATDEFDALWRSVQASYQMSVIRDAAFLDWRFTNHPSRQYTIYAYRSAVAGKLLGYAVVGLDDTNARVVDCLMPRDPRKIGDFFGRLAVVLANRGVERMETWLPANHFFAEALVEAGLVSGSEPLGIIFTMVDFEKDPTTAWVSDNLYYTMADADLM